MRRLKSESIPDLPKSEPKNRKNKIENPPVFILLSFAWFSTLPQCAKNKPFGTFMDKIIAFVPVCAADDNILMKRYCIAQCLKIFEKVSFEFPSKMRHFVSIFKHCA